MRSKLGTFLVSPQFSFLKATSLPIIFRKMAYFIDQSIIFCLIKRSLFNSMNLCHKNQNFWWLISVHFLSRDGLNVTHEKNESKVVLSDVGEGILLVCQFQFCPLISTLAWRIEKYLSRQAKYMNRRKDKSGNAKIIVTFEKLLLNFYDFIPCLSFRVTLWRNILSVCTLLSTDLCFLAADFKQISLTWKGPSDT